MKQIMEISNVSKDYGEDEIVVHALRNVSLTISAGEFAVMAGPSGSGKSTLLNILGGLDRPTSGTVRIEGKDLSTLSSGDLSALRRDRIGFVFQSYNLLPVLTALENAEYVLMLQGIGPKERRARVLEILREVGLSGLEDRFPKQLSGGQQQRVAIARALAANPAIILADEPTANVDSKTAGSLLDLMQRLNQDRGVTFLFSTHDGHVMSRAKRMIWLKDGSISYDGPPSGLPPEGEEHEGRETSQAT